MQGIDKSMPYRRIAYSIFSFVNDAGNTHCGWMSELLNDTSVAVRNMPLKKNKYIFVLVLTKQVAMAIRHWQIATVSASSALGPDSI